MYRVTIICIGKLNMSFYAQGVQEYAKRLTPFCKLDIIELPEESISDKTASNNQIEIAINKEGKQILGCIPKNAYVISLCVEGKQLSSESFAEKINSIGLQGQGNIAFIIGSSRGLADIVKQKSNLKLSFSDMTFTHQMARFILTEQLYRAFMILSGGKYHK